MVGACNIVTHGFWRIWPKEQCPGILDPVNVVKWVFNNDFKVFHRLYDIINLSIVSEKNTVGYYDMNSVIEVK